MAAAYAFAEGGPITDEIALIRSLDRFGVQAIYGRPLSFHEIRMLVMAENVTMAYIDRMKSENWVYWAENNPDKSALLALAGRLYNLQDNE